MSSEASKHAAASLGDSEPGPGTQNIPVLDPRNDEESDDSGVEVEGPRAGAKRKRIASKRCEWSEKFVCDHSGKYRDRKKANLSPSKRRPHRKRESLKVGCRAQILLQKRIGVDQVEITYNFEHTGHVVGSLKDFRESRMSERVREWIADRVGDGMDWRAIKDLLRLDEEILNRVFILLNLCTTGSNSFLVDRRWERY